MPTVEERIRSLWSSRPDEDVEYVSPSYTFAASTSTRRSLAKLTGFAIAVSGIFVWLNRPHAQDMPQIIASGSPISVAPISSAAMNIVVDVEGKVHHAGLQTLPSGSRVADAIAAAGGLKATINNGELNLAARLSDGQLLFVGRPQGGAAAESSGNSTNSGGTTQISLNSATESDFESLPGVGPVLAKRILDWRTQHGTFSSLQDLQNIPGIGPKVFANLSPYLTL